MSASTAFRDLNANLKKEYAKCIERRIEAEGAFFSHLKVISGMRARTWRQRLDDLRREYLPRRERADSWKDEIIEDARATAAMEE